MSKGAPGLKPSQKSAGEKAIGNETKRQMNSLLFLRTKRGELTMSLVAGSIMQEGSSKWQDRL